MTDLEPDDPQLGRIEALLRIADLCGRLHMRGIGDSRVLGAIQRVATRRLEILAEDDLELSVELAQLREKR